MGFANDPTLHMIEASFVGANVRKIYERITLARVFSSSARSAYPFSGACQTWTVLSQLPEAISRPLGDQATDATLLLCPR